MAKSMNESESTDGVITIDVKALMTPLSIIIGAVIISGVIFVTRNDGNVAGTAINTGSDTGGTVPTEDVQPTLNGSTTLDDDPVMGDLDTAKVAIVEFSDYECPFCKRHHEETKDQIISQYIDTGDAVMVFRDFPLSFHDPLATQEAMAAECVQDLAGDAKYYEYGDLIFGATNSNVGLDPAELYTLAGQVGVDADDFKKCLDSEQFKDEVTKDLADGQAAGVTGTPGFIIGKLDKDGNVVGEVIAGAQPFSVFQATIEKYLK